MFRFGAVLTVVLVAIGLLVGGVLANSLPLVVAAIAVAALAGVLLVIGVLFRRDQIFGSSGAGRPVEAAGLRSAAPAAGNRSSGSAA